MANHHYRLPHACSLEHHQHCLLAHASHDSPDNTTACSCTPAFVWRPHFVAARTAEMSSLTSANDGCSRMGIIVTFSELASPLSAYAAAPVTSWSLRTSPQKSHTVVASSSSSNVTNPPPLFSPLSLERVPGRHDKLAWLHFESKEWAPHHIYGCRGYKPRLILKKWRRGQYLAHIDSHCSRDTARRHTHTLLRWMNTELFSMLLEHGVHNASDAITPSVWRNIRIKPSTTLALPSRRPPSSLLAKTWISFASRVAAEWRDSLLHASLFVQYRSNS